MTVCRAHGQIERLTGGRTKVLCENPGRSPARNRVARVGEKRMGKTIGALVAVLVAERTGITIGALIGVLVAVLLAPFVVLVIRRRK